MGSEFFADKRGVTKSGNQVILMTSVDSSDYLVVVVLEDGSDIDVYGYTDVHDAEASFAEFIESDS